MHRWRRCRKATHGYIKVVGPELAAPLCLTSPSTGPLIDLRAHLDVGAARLPGWTATSGPGGDVAPFAVVTANGRF